MTHVVTLALDLRRPEGRAAMRAYMDAIEAVEELTPTPPAAPPVDETGAALTHRSILYRAFGLDPTRASGAVEPAAVGESTTSPVVMAETPGCAQQAEEPPAPDEPVSDVSSAAPGKGEPEPSWTDDLKRQVWAMHEAGLASIEIAARIGMRVTRVRSFVTNVRKGSVRLPPAPTGGALVPVPAQGGAVALRDVRRPVAQDAGMQSTRLEEMARAEREKLVAKAACPEAYS